MAELRTERFRATQPAVMKRSPERCWRGSERRYCCDCDRAVKASQDRPLRWLTVACLSLHGSCAGLVVGHFV